jgi:hypothetical protein
LALALVAAASTAGSWCAAVGVGRPPLGPVAAAELGVVLERFPLVAVPPRSGPPGAARGGWPWVVAALLDAVDVVVAWPPPHLRAADARRLVARGRERASVLVVPTPFGHGAATPFGHGAATPFGHGAATPFGHGAGWPEAVDVRLAVVASTWEGMGDGHGRLLARRVEVEATGRGAAARPRRVALWLPAPGGGVEARSGAATPLRGGHGSAKAVGG